VSTRDGFRFGEALPSAQEAERLLGVSTRLVLEAQGRNEALAALDLEGEIERVEHEWHSFRGARIHLERHGDDSKAATFVIAHGLGDHARRQLGLAATLSQGGYNSLVVDRPGHGLSEGRRGDATLEEDLGVLELAIGLARAGSSGPVVVLGDSLGGIMSWYLLTREPDVDAAICHCIGHPDVHPSRSFARKAPLMRRIGRVAPQLRIGVRQIADYSQVALDPVTRSYFEQETDDLFNFEVTARSVASYIGFEPTVAWEQVSTPVLVLIGSADGMVTPKFTRRSLERARPPRADYMEIDGAGHQLFLDDLGKATGPVLEWTAETLA